jgi:choline dehydrogenase
VRGRSNLEIWTQAEADQLILDSGPDGALRCAGVRPRRKDQPVEVRASRDVVLAAGAVNSPKLMMLSGLGPGATLRDHGSVVRADLPGVGGNLQDHLQLRCIYKVHDVETLNTRARASSARRPSRSNTR